MVEPSEYIDGVRVRWGRVASTLLGATILAYFQGAVATLLSLADIPIGLLGGLGEFLGSFVAVALGIWPAMIRGGWAGAAGFVLEAGIAGFAAAVAIVLLTFYVAREVYSLATN